MRLTRLRTMLGYRTLWRCDVPGVPTDRATRQLPPLRRCGAVDRSGRGIAQVDRFGRCMHGLADALTRPGSLVLAGSLTRPASVVLPGCLTRPGSLVLPASVAISLAAALATFLTAFFSAPLRREI